jgi:hypothetical protein
MKKIPKSDISIRPFKVYKSYTATNADSGSGYERLFANHYLESGEYFTIDPLNVTGVNNINSHTLWHQIKRMYYDQVYNPLRTYSREIPDYVTDTTSYGKRNLGAECIVFTIPQNHYGEEIKPIVDNYLYDREGTTSFEVPDIPDNLKADLIRLLKHLP